MTKRGECVRYADAELYLVRAAKQGEWAYITINERLGLFQACSSYGNFAYCWTAIGKGTLKEFLADLNFDYFFGKVAASRGERFSAAKSAEAMKTFAREIRRDGAITKSQARGVYDVAERAAEAHDEREFFDIIDDRDVYALYDGDFHGIARHERDPQCVGFWEHIWPEFLKATKPKRYRIVPKQDFGSGPGYWMPGVPGGVGTGSYGFVKSGFVVTDGMCNVMPGATWFRTVAEAFAGIAALEKSEGNSDVFWNILQDQRAAA